MQCGPEKPQKRHRILRETVSALKSSSKMNSAKTFFMNSLSSVFGIL